MLWLCWQGPAAAIEAEKRLGDLSASEHLLQVALALQGPDLSEADRALEDVMQTMIALEGVTHDSYSRYQVPFFYCEHHMDVSQHLQTTCACPHVPVQQDVQS